MLFFNISFIWCIIWYILLEIIIWKFVRTTKRVTLDLCANADKNEFDPIWTIASADDALKSGLYAGSEADGKKVYVGRVTDDSGNFIPAKIIPDVKQSFFESAGREQSSEKIEFLSNDNVYEWIQSSNGASFPNAVTIGGFLIGRGVWNGNVVVGRVDLNAKQLIATYDGKKINLPDYDVLTFKSQDNASKQQSVPSSVVRTQTVNTIVSKSNFSETNHKEPLLNQQRYFEMLNKIQTLELELASYKHDREAYESRIDFEQKRVDELSKKLQALRLENSSLNQERITWEERITTETTLITEMESKLQSVLVDNAFLLKKVSSLEDDIKYERYQVSLVNEKYQRDISSGSSLQVKVKNFEETVRTQKQRILELEGALDNINNGSGALTQQVKTYEVTIQSLRSQIDGLMKKLQSSNGDNDFLVKKLSLLTDNLKSYQSQLESMSRKLQNSKIIIATANGELARATAQLARYQAALSHCYMLNGELMTKVSGFSTMSQFEGQYTSQFDIFNMSRDLSIGVTSSKAISFNSTSALLEASGSESYVSLVRENGTESEGSSLN